MTTSQFDLDAQNRVPWNFGAKIGPKRPFNLRAPLILAQNFVDPKVGLRP
ncbi:hypothetical protein GCM10011371_34870 [Novosphingobium marinum]|nr:hypothetical protein GCM10011371_34870 [Novosphingobium marinum]